MVFLRWRAGGGGSDRLQRGDPAGGYRHLRVRAARAAVKYVREGALLGEAGERGASFPFVVAPVSDWLTPSGLVNASAFYSQQAAESHSTSTPTLSLRRLATSLARRIQ